MQNTDERRHLPFRIKSRGKPDNKNHEEWIINNICCEDGENAYLDQCWESSCKEDPQKCQRQPCKKGTKPLQKRVRLLLEEILELEPRDVCASNLIFFRSKNANGVHYPEDADRCWPIHALILQIVQPKLIIAFGNGEKESTYSYLRDKFYNREQCEEEVYLAGYDNWKVRSFRCRLKVESPYADIDIGVVGLPHLSRYTIDTETNKKDKDAVIKLLKSKLHNNPI